MSGAAVELAEVLDELPLIDHHVHGVLTADVDRAGFEDLITEAFEPAAAGTTGFDSQVGFAVRRHCAPVLGLPPHASPDDYIARRRELGAREVNRRLLAASGIAHLLIDTGHRSEEITDPAATAALAGQRADEIVQLEPIAEDLAVQGCAAAGFADAFATRLAWRASSAVGLKTVVAYRTGLELDPSSPTPVQVRDAAGRWLRAVEAGEPPRLTDPVLLRHVIGAGLDLGLPLQVHVGYGDPDLRLHRCNPLLMTDFLAASPRDVPVMLLHCYPFHREAGYLAQVFPHVYMDVGEAVNYTGARSPAVLAESLELTPFGKTLFSSDAWGAAELHHLGAVLWRRGMSTALARFVDAGEWTTTDAVRVVTMIGRDNARRVYRLVD